MAKAMEEMIGAISEMSVLQVSELVKALEEKFGVSAAAPMAVAVAPVAAGAAAEEEEQTEFTVLFKGFGEGKKIPVIKEVRGITALGLKEAKELVEAGDKPIKEGVSKDEATAIKDKIEAAGGVVEIK